MKQFINLFSYIFHPLFIPIMVAMFYFYFASGYPLFNEIYFVVIQTFIVTIVIPLLFFALLKVLKKADSLMFADINQRKLPLIIQIGLLFYLIYFVIKIEYFYTLHVCFLASIVSTFLAFILLFFNKKASLHMLGITSFLTFVVLLSVSSMNNYIIPIAILVFSCGAVATSRLLLKAHTPTELVLGSIIGILPQLAFARFWF